MADNRKYYYLKLKEDFFESDEAVILESMPDGYIYSNILLKLYLRSLKNNGLLMFNNLIPYNSQMLATITRHQVGTIEKAVKIFKDLQLIEILDNGAIYMTNIQNFVGKSSSEADRIRKLRAKNNSGVQMLNKCTPEIEIEKDIKTDIDINIELEVDNEKTATDTNIYDYYQQRIGSLDGYQYEKLKDYLDIDKLEPELVKRAIDRGADNSKRNFGYINKILKNWAQNGIRTIAQQDEEQRQFVDSKANKQKSNDWVPDPNYPAPY
ncbi:phage replisome organizer N-terminal domain-containing protein [Streptococcus suis]|uniref:phage replisome organizer N-terminal domain-containing protein n=1 Tax=Streptococcus suis TaxID=1307 RepID=UPI0009443FEA|nr:phage replisome organizer N-terminal domain-containing protein [Streptococcus suis]MCB2883664.1 phage replisome organizer N-terminal domain-containing protein [Streptococcus suis]MCB2910427.1 phage replisome organizer N-terminal domain-containing protein [Streptococcus suis]MCB2912502.1 phage replisome organizer N-terminal domain-containing protein [Streptococcus suis]WNF60376.1 phage replisome organizer N-terminal domain-containing protein [Streptococcus suis]HEL1698390.1 phage replisome o